jgi:hypothetical protein
MRRPRTAVPHQSRLLRLLRRAPKNYDTFAGLVHQSHSEQTGVLEHASDLLLVGVLFQAGLEVLPPLE